METDSEFALAGHLPTILWSEGNKSPSGFDCSDREYMKLAIRRAMETHGLTAPNPTVGCLIVKDGRIVSHGSTLAAGDWHAERVALSQQGDSARLRGATLYCTLEPCAHTGRQPPCCEAIAASGISKCVIGVQDPDSRVNGRGISYLQRSGVLVEAGVLHNECFLWHLPFLLAASLDRPFIALKWAQTLDGQLAYDAGDPQWITGSEAARYSHWLRQRYDAVVIGANTALNDLCRLNVRYYPFKKHRDPVRFVCDPTGRLLISDRWPQVFETTLAPDGMAIYLGPSRVDSSSFARMDKLATQRNVIVRRIEAGQGLVQSILAVLAENEVEQRCGRSFRSLMVEGGPRLHRLFLESGHVDAAHVLVAPGFGSGVGNRVLPDWNPGERMHVTGAYRLGNDVLVEMVSSQISSLIRNRSPLPNRTLVQDVERTSRNGHC